MPSYSSRFWWAVILGAVGVVIGWQLFLFTTDDAYIIFRYMGQRQAGFGYVWNGPPFLPVEGYSCFGWLVLLDVVCSLFACAPDVAANWLSLLASVGSLFIVARIAWKNSDENSGDGAYLAWVLFGLVTSRLFLTWTSSGLETALFNLLILVWLYKGVLGGWKRVPKPSAAVLYAALLSLIRPDGYLFLMASVGWFALENLRASSREEEEKPWGNMWPVLLVLAHVLWRKSFYGEWLPNTYYAKVVGPLPDIGFRYLISFAMEHGLLVVLALLAWAGWKGRVFRFQWKDLGRWVAAATLLAHTFYYVVIAGGDHFEYRILSHWAPLMALGSVWAVFAVSERRVARIGGLLLLWLCTHTLPWIHFGVSQEHMQWSREMPRYPVATELPEVLEPFAREFDELQQWLFRHGVGMRHQHHKLFSEYQLGQLPTRSEAATWLEGEKNPVVVVTSAGIAGWNFLDAHVLDVFGLNDYVVARTPPRTRESARVVAHSRQPPQGYIEAFRPNVIVTPSRVSPVRKRQRVLTNEEIVRLEERFRAALPLDRNTPMSERAK